MQIVKIGVLLADKCSRGQSIGQATRRCWLSGWTCVCNEVSTTFDEPKDLKTLWNSESVLILDKKYIGSLHGLDRYRYLLVVYYFHRSQGYHEQVHPMGDQSIPKRGVLATRSPCRPNPIGITVAEILSMNGKVIKVTGLDALNGTPILDIKPYEVHFDSHDMIKKL
ncbi:MAG: tRNA (N6-threonylcarbamoyladenosine(37)-N6)-methyltransferase TrmO [Methanothrix sp.]|nr:tRNA (N6-threonylcarbamoyladenosine(37)-N6)-methyltransferase TrmO [Methanothrix sp.]